MDNLKYTTIAEEINYGRPVTIFTKGVSMQPLLVENKTHVTIAPIIKPKKNDILLYKRKNGQLVLHRLIKAKNGFYFMRGDNTFGLEKIDVWQAIGVVTHIYKNGKNFAVTKKSYKFYVWFRNLSYPFRWLGFKIKNLMRKMFKKENKE